MNAQLLFLPCLDFDEAGPENRRILDISRDHACDLGRSAVNRGLRGFCHNPVNTAADFRHASEHEFRRTFSEVIFAMTDWLAERRFLGPFRELFSSSNESPAEQGPAETSS